YRRPHRPRWRPQSKQKLESPPGESTIRRRRCCTCEGELIRPRHFRARRRRPHRLPSFLHSKAQRIPGSTSHSRGGHTCTLQLEQGCPERQVVTQLHKCPKHPPPRP